MTTTSDVPEWEFFLTIADAKALSQAGQMLLTSWQRLDEPSKSQLKQQRRLAEALERFVPQVTDVLYSEPS